MVVGVGAGTQPIQVGMVGQQLYQPAADRQVVGVGYVPHYPCRRVHVTAVGQHPSQTPCGLMVADVSAGAQLVHVATVGEHLSQPPRGKLVADDLQRPEMTLAQRWTVIA
jgi:hypothetical protein